MESQKPDGAAPVPLPRRSPIGIIIPAGVVALTVAMLAWSAWPTLAPTTTVHVAQAVFESERSTREAASESQQDVPEGQPRVTSPVQAAGWLEAEPFYVAASALADGVIRTMNVLEGDPITEGDVIATLVDDDAKLRVRKAEADLLTAEADLMLAEAELEAAQTEWAEPVQQERDVEVSRAQVAEAKAELARLPSRVASARATLVQYEEELARSVESQAGRAATELEVIIDRQRAAAQQAMVESMEAEQPLLQARVDRLSAELRAAERELTLRIEEKQRLGVAKANVARAEAERARSVAVLDEAKLELERMTIRAPIGGYVQERLKLPGDKVVRMADQPHSAHVVHIYDPARLQVRVDVPLADASNVFVGQECEVIVEVLPETVFKGKVLRITHEADLQKNTLQVKVGVTEPSPFLRPEMLTRVKFLPNVGAATTTDAPQQQTAVRVPAEAIVQDTSGGGSLIWLVTAREGRIGIARAVPVESISETDGWVQVQGTLSPGALVVISPTGLQPGQRVRFTAAAKEEEGAA